MFLVSWFRLVFAPDGHSRVLHCPLLQTSSERRRKMAMMNVSRPSSWHEWQTLHSIRKILIAHLQVISPLPRTMDLQSSRFNLLVPCLAIEQACSKRAVE